MPRSLSKAFGWGGLSTKADPTGLPLLECVHVQDMRLVGMDLVERLGIVRIGKLSYGGSAGDLTAASSEDYANTIDSRVWALGLYWTVEFTIEADATAGTIGVICAGHTTPAMIFDITGGDIRFRVWDSAGTPTTITVGAASTSTQTVQVTRSADVLTTRLDNGTPVTGSMSATLDVRTPVGDLRIGRDDGSNYFDGTIDYVRVLSIVKADHSDRLVRLPNPRAQHVLADYDFSVTGTLVYDRSRYENALIASNTPGSTTSLCHRPAPVRGISMLTDKNFKRQLAIVSGGSYYTAAVD